MSSCSVELYWIPLGAGTPVVRLSGRIFEWFAAHVGRRQRCDLYHSALVIELDGVRTAIEMAPVADRDGVERRGVVGEGPVGSPLLGRWGVFRYEIRSWRNGLIPDLRFAVQSPIGLTDDPETASRVLDLAAQVPTPTWGRDELRAGEMWNSNSVVSWLIERAGLDVSGAAMPDRGRAPGWDAGVVVARRPRR